MVFSISKNYSLDSIEAEKNGNEKPVKHRNHEGMHWFTAVFFIIGDMMGGGLIALPIAINDTGYIPGMILLVICAIFSGYTGLQLGWNWTLMQSRWPGYTEHCRRPYPEMAFRALGHKAKIFVSICICVTQFGIVVVLSLLASKNLSNFIDYTFDVQISFCLNILIVTAIVWPFIMLKSPMDFWQAAVGAAITSTIAAGLVIAGAIHDAPVCKPAVMHDDFAIKKAFLGYGTIAFAYGGHAAFPTIQHDMKKPFRFNRSVITSYTFILLIYLASSSAAYFVYGNSMRDTIIPSLQVGWMSQTVNIMITLHVLPAIVIVFSPWAQQMEDWTKVPHHFCWQRILLRSLLLFACLFTGLSLPNFGVFLDLVGGSTITLMTMLLPSVFYLYIFASKRKREEAIISGEITENSPDNVLASVKDVWKYSNRWILFFNIITFTFGTLGGVAATYSAISELLSANMDSPCYVQWIKHGFSPIGDLGGATNCCGDFRNVTVSGISPLHYCSL